MKSECVLVMNTPGNMIGSSLLLPVTGKKQIIYVFVLLKLHLKWKISKITQLICRKVRSILNKSFAHCFKVQNLPQISHDVFHAIII